MPIPDFLVCEYLPYRILPEGVYDATLVEIEARFSYWGRTGRRMRLMDNLGRYVQEVRFWQFAAELFIDGSFVCEKEEPDDINILVIYQAGFDIAREGQPMLENLQDNKHTRREYGINLWVAERGSRAYQQKFDDLTTVHTEEKIRTDAKKGVVRLLL